MKRHKDLYPQLITFPQILKAYKKALKGSGKTREALAFQFDLEANLLQLQEELKNKTYEPAPYRYFRIQDPKARLISMAPFRDRVVHHAIIQVLEPIFEPTFIYDSYATRKGKGSHAAILKAQSFLKKYQWFYKADIDQYFASIDHEILLDLIHRKVKDRDFMEITEKVIRNGGQAGKGLPIGNLTSQFFANVYLNPLDHYIKEILRIKAYVRYMDDWVIWNQDKKVVKKYRHQIRGFLKEKLALDIKEKASFLNQGINGLSFLGARIFSNSLRIHPKNLKRVFQKIEAKTHAYHRGEMVQEDFLQAMNSSWAHLAFFDSYALRNSYLGQNTTRARTV